jgi:all-trans-retinol 13,14-reductase
MKFDIIIIGSGLGGLLCANILSKEGYNVCLIEKNSKLGGSLQTFGRKACLFDTGLHYTESLEKGQVLHQYFSYFGLTDKVRFKKLNEDGFDIIDFPDGQYKLAMGQENYKETLLSHFPGERDGLSRYLRKIKEICSSIPLYNLSDQPYSIFDDNSLGTGAADYIRSEIGSYRLQNIIAGNSMMYAGDLKRTPLMIHAIINSSFIESAWRIVGGSHTLVNVLAGNLLNNGGSIMRNASGEKFIIRNKRIEAVQLQTGEILEANYFISNAHPEHTLKMLGQNRSTRMLADQIHNLKDTPGMFTLYLVFKKDTFPYLNYNFYHYNQDNAWAAGEYNPSTWPQVYMFNTVVNTQSDYYAKNASAITYMGFDEVQKWKNTFTGNRGEDYLMFKQEKSERLLNELEKKFPGIRSCVAATYSSTPLTWRDYTGTRNGSAYGVWKDSARPIESFIMPQTRISNLSMTGQNISVHGILGVTISSVLSCSNLVNMKELLTKIRNC